MKKAGIVTLHHSANFGALLQSYALRKTINSFDGIDADIINFRPSQGAMPQYGIPELDKKSHQQMERFNAFRRDILGIKTKMFYEITPDISSGYDYFIAGSDQIWNPSFAAHDSYFLSFAPENVTKISYAASIGKPVDDISNSDVEKFKRFIPAFDFLSIREKEHEAFIRKFTDKQVSTVLDPTLLLEASDYTQITSRQPNDKYIMLYFLNHDLTAPHILSFANRISIEYGLPIKHNFAELPTCALKNEGESYRFAGVEEFLGIAKNAEMIITNSFHGTVFSILFGKPFYTFIVQSMASRIYSLLDSLGLSDRIVDSYKPLGDVLFDLDLSDAYLRMEGMRDHSMKFLKTALGVCDRKAHKNEVC